MSTRRGMRTRGVLEKEGPEPRTAEQGAALPGWAPGETRLWQRGLRGVTCGMCQKPSRGRGDTAHRKVSLQELCHTWGREAAQGSCCPPRPCRNPAGEGTDCTEVSFGGVNPAAGSPASRSWARGHPQQECTARPEPHPPTKPAEPPRGRTLAFLLQSLQCPCQPPGIVASDGGAHSLLQDLRGRVPGEKTSGATSLSPQGHTLPTPMEGIPC